MAQASWGANTQARPGRSRGLWFGRGLWTLALALLAVALIWLMARPFWHPRTHLVLLSGDVATFRPEPLAAPADFVAEDFRALLRLESVLHRGLTRPPAPLMLGSLQSPEEMQKLADRLNLRLTGRADVLILYVAAHGLTQDGDAWLVPGGAGLGLGGTAQTSPLAGRYRLASLLAQLRECTAQTKLLVLDAGRIEYDPLRGLLDNDFPQRLVEQVQALGDSSIYVLASHAAGERSHRSPALRRTVFNYFVASGLAGQADENGNRAVDLAELSRFVQSGVSGWVRQTTGEAAEQTPLLVYGAGDALPRILPVLIAVPPPREEAGKSESAKSPQVRDIEAARDEAEVDPRLVGHGQSELNGLIARGVSQGTPQGRVGHFLGDAVCRGLAKAISAAPQVSDNSAAAKTAEKTAEKADPAPDAKADAKSKQSPSESDRPAAVADASVAKPPAGPASRELAESVARVWKLRDKLADAARPDSRPVDYAPHLWRQFEQRLLTADRHVRTGFLFDTRSIAAELAELEGTLSALATMKNQTAVLSAAPAIPLATAIASLTPGRPLAAAEPSSLAAAELLSRSGARPLGEEELLWSARLDRLIAAGNRTDLESFAAELKPEHERWLELRIARQLAARPDLDWRVIQLTLEAARLSEQSAVGLGSAVHWVRSAVDATDGQRLVAERQILAGATLDRDFAVTQLTQAVAAYKQTLADLAAIRAAECLASDVWLRLPDLLTWHAAAGDVPGAGPKQAELTSLITKISQLDEALLRPQADRVRAAIASAGELQSAFAAACVTASPQSVEQLLTLPASPGKAWKIALLLETPLPTAEMRSALAAGWPEIDGALAAQVEPEIGATPSAAASNSIRATDNRFVARAALQLQLWTTAARDLAGTDRDLLSASWEALTKPTARQVGASAASQDSRREQFSARLHDLLRDLPADIARGAQAELDLNSPASRAARIVRLTGWNRLLRVVDPRTAAESAAPAVFALQGAAAFDWLVWMKARAERAAQDAAPADAAYYRRAADTYRTAAAAIPRQPPQESSQTSPLEITGPDHLALTYLSRRHAEFTLRNTSAAPHKVWLTFEADDRLEVTSADGRAIYNWLDVQANDANSGETSASRASRLRPSLELAPGQTLQVPLRVARRQASLRTAHLIVRVLTAEHGEHTEQANRAEQISRHDLDIELPPPEDVQLTVAGPPGRWTPQPSGAELLPFPNRVNEFVLQLASGKPSDRQVDVEVFPLLSSSLPDLPAEPLAAADAGLLRRTLSLGPIVAEARGLVLIGGGEVVTVPLEKPKAPPPSPAPAGDKAASPANTAPASASGKPEPVPLAQGLLIVVTDTADQRQSFRRLAIAPQRPQRYIRAQVRYRAARERIEIVVRPQDASLLPTGGVRLRAEIAESLGADAERQLEAVLAPPAGEAELFAEVPLAPGKFVTLALTVDDYPRAIYFRVPCSGETIDVPEDLDLLAVRIRETPSGTIYRPPTSSIPLRLAIDAPAAALKNPPLALLVGIDRNRDRELGGDESITVTADRQVTASLVGLTKAGALQIEALVTDVAVEIPAGSLANGRVNLLAQAQLGEREAWSTPVEIVSDGQPPRLSALQTRPAGAVVIGGEVLVSALADDQGLSGVAQVEVALDLDRSGKFGPATKALPATLAADGRWTAKLPTAGLGSGPVNILVRATDRAGNISEPARVPLRVVTAEEVAQASAADIAGVVTYGGQPQAGVSVSLLAEGTPPPAPKSKGKAKAAAPPPLAQATTDSQGAFTFQKIAPGKYVVVAEGLVRNKNRRAEQPVAFTKPADLQPLTLEFK